MLKFSAIRKAAVRICGGQTVTAATAMRYLVTLSNTDTSGISILQLKDGPLNKLSPDMMRDIVGSVKEAEARSNCRGLIITSTGRLFSVGLDMTYLLNPNKDALREYWSAYRELCLTMYGTRLATVAGMDGHTLGAGCALALCCDTRVLLKSAKIGLNEAEYGLRIPSWMVDILTNTIGNHHAERACSLGFIFDSDHASTIGLVDVVSRLENFSVDSYKEALLWSNIPGRELNKQLYRESLLSKWNNPEIVERDFEMFFEVVTDRRRQAVLSAYMDHLAEASDRSENQHLDEKNSFEDGDDENNNDNDSDSRFDKYKNSRSGGGSNKNSVRHRGGSGAQQYSHNRRTSNSDRYERGDRRGDSRGDSRGDRFSRSDRESSPRGRSRF